MREAGHLGARGDHVEQRVELVAGRRLRVGRAQRESEKVEQRAEHQGASASALNLQLY